MTKQELVDDIVLRVTKSAPSDDLELEPRQIAHWFDLAAKEVVPKFLDAKAKKDEPIDESLIEIEDDLAGTVEDVVMLDTYSDRVYIQVSKKILGLGRDRGLIRVITEEGQVVTKIPISRLDDINKMTFSRPNRENLVHTRINNKIYIHGLNPLHVGLVKFSVTYVPEINISDLDDSDEVTIPDELLNLISDVVEDRAKRQMFGIADLENDAEDDPKAISIRPQPNPNS